jgi:predicted DCC family thiol-disulfide oxidoreductase YuxK
MPASPAQVPRVPEGAHLVLYDGVCGLCNRLLQFLLKHDRRAVFTFASLQSEVGGAMVERFGGNPNDLTSFCVVADYRTSRTQMFVRSRAALFVAGTLGWPWKASVMFGVLPAALLDRAYDVVARHRYRVFGRSERCLLPRPEVRHRFID